MEKNIYLKLKEIQSLLKAPKSQFNKFGKYNYRSCEDILNAVKPLLHERDCMLLLNDELVNIGERYYIKATATIQDCESPFTTLSVTSYAREEESKKGMDGSQVTGASSSYARKYALNGLFNIDDTKDSDATNDGSYEQKKHNKEPKQEQQYFCQECGTEIKNVKKQDGTIVEAKQVYDSCGGKCVKCFTKGK